MLQFLVWCRPLERGWEQMHLKPSSGDAKLLQSPQRGKDAAKSNPQKQQQWEPS